MNQQHQIVLTVVLIVAIVVAAIAWSILFDMVGLNARC